MVLLGEQVINKITSAENNFRTCSFLHRDVIVKAYFLGSRVSLGRWHLSQDMNNKWLFPGKVHFRQREEQRSWWGRESVWIPTWTSRVMKFKMWGLVNVQGLLGITGRPVGILGVGILSLTQPQVQLGITSTVCDLWHIIVSSGSLLLPAWLPAPGDHVDEGRHLRNMKCCTIFRWYHYLKTRYPQLRDLDFGGSSYLVDQIFWGELQSPP